MAKEEGREIPTKRVSSSQSCPAVPASLWFPPVDFSPSVTPWEQGDKWFIQLSLLGRDPRGADGQSRTWAYTLRWFLCPLFPGERKGDGGRKFSRRHTFIVQNHVFSHAWLYLRITCSVLRKYQPPSAPPPVLISLICNVCVCLLVCFWKFPCWF